MFKEQIQKEMITAMKEKNAVKVQTLRSIKASLINAEIANSNYNHIDVLNSMSKQRKQSIEQYEIAGNTKLCDIEINELNIIESYLPKQFNDVEIDEKINEIISTYEKIEIKDMSSIINTFKSNYPGQDMNKVSKLIRTKIF